MKTLSISFWLLALAALANAQDLDFTRFYGFLTVVPTNAAFTVTPTGFLPPLQASTMAISKTDYGFGAGVENRLSHEGKLHRIGLGFDLSTLFPGTGKTWSQATVNVGANGYYHPYSNDNIDLFVIAGYAGMFRGVSANGFNGGGGLNFWFGRGALGATVEVRELVFSSSPALPATHYTEFRFGLAHRSK
jgi:hypothetical protein